MLTNGRIPQGLNRFVKILLCYLIYQISELQQYITTGFVEVHTKFYDSRPPRVRGASELIDLDNVPVYAAPKTSRCAAKARGCADAMYLAQTYVRRLSTGDQVCLEGGFGEPLTNECRARSAVVDTAPNRVLIEVREAKPGSKWFDKEIHQFWFEEGALVDLALAERGY